MPGIQNWAFWHLFFIGDSLRCYRSSVTSSLANFKGRFGPRGRIFMGMGVMEEEVAFLSEEQATVVISNGL